MKKSRLYTFLFLILAQIILLPSISFADCKEGSVNAIRDAAIERLGVVCKEFTDYATSTYNSAAQDYISSCNSELEVPILMPDKDELTVFDRAGCSASNTEPYKYLGAKWDADISKWKDEKQQACKNKLLKAIDAYDKILPKYYGAIKIARTALVSPTDCTCDESGENP